MVSSSVKHLCCGGLWFNSRMIVLVEDLIIFGAVTKSIFQKFACWFRCVCPSFSSFVEMGLVDRVFVKFYIG